MVARSVAKVTKAKAAAKKVAAKKKKAAPTKVAAKKAAPKRAAPKKKKVAAPKKAAPKKAKRAIVVRDRARLARDGERFGAATIQLHNLPELHLPSGQIVTCDPFLVEGPTLARKVKPGAYPVVLAVATFPTGPNEHDKGDQRIASAFVRFRSSPVTAWVAADFLGAGPPPPGTEPAYGVDAGTGCFMDARAHKAIAAEPPHWPTPSYTALEHQLLTEHYTHTWGWAEYHPDAKSPANCVAFMSGWGDGAYTSYWGLDQRGQPAVLLTDFEVFTDEDWAS
jgi:hypothetical protein